MMETEKNEELKKIIKKRERKSKRKMVGKKKNKS